jgi:hypothetical protein
MSTLVAQTISNGTVSTSSANVINGSAKAWVNFNGTGTVAIRAAFNVSSITDSGTGQYTVNFTTAMSDANYNAVFGAGAGSANSDVVIQERYASPSRTTSALAIVTTNGGFTFFDPQVVSASIFR